MRRAAVALPVGVCVLVVAAVALTGPSDGVAALMLIAGAVTAIGIVDLLARRGR